MSPAAGLWPEIALRRAFSVVNGATPDSQNAAFWGGDVPWITPEDLSERQDRLIRGSKRTLTEAGYEACGTTLVPPGSIVLSTRAPIGNLGIADVPLCTNQGCRSLVPKGDLDARFFFYSLSVSTAELNQRGRGTTFLELSSQELSAFKVPLPPKPDQERIANFLDEQTARIDALIAEKERLASSLDELFLASLEAAFTGAGVSGDRVSTGNDFFPELPRCWKQSALKHLLVTPVTDGPHETPEILLEGIPFVSAEAIKGGRVDFDRKRGFISPEIHIAYCKKVKPRRDDIFVVKSGNTTGAVAIVETDDEFSVWSPLAVLRADSDKVLPRFLFLALQAPYFQRSIQLYWSQGTQPNIGMAVLENLRILVPPLNVQLQLVEDVGAVRLQCDDLKKHCFDHIERLKEYRSSLISAAVTGQLDLGAFDNKKAA